HLATCSPLRLGRVLPRMMPIRVMGDLSKIIVAMTSKQIDACRVKYYDGGVKTKSTSDPSVVPLAANEEDFLRAFMRTMVAVPRAFDADLLREQGMSVSEYATLMH